MATEAEQEVKPSSEETKANESKKPNKQNKLKAFYAKLLKTKKRRIIAGVIAGLIVLGIIFAVPYTRYAVAGLVVKKSATVTIVDSVSSKPVSEVAVTLGSKTVKTDAKGQAKFNAVPVGDYKLKLDKKYYEAQQPAFRVPILVGPPNAKYTIKATGRAVLVKVTNKVSGTPLEKAKVSASDTTAVTDKNGEASIVLPISSKVQKAKVEAEGFNAADLELTVTNADNQKSNAALIPAGKIYYLSKSTGKINVVKSNLDGTDRQVVLEGTGRENDYSTALLASRDWKYLALLAKRDSDKPKIYLINTSNDKLSVIDEGDVDFQLAGWSDHYFVYSLTRNKPNYWDDKKRALKSFNAESSQLRTLDETAGAGTNSWDYAYEDLANIFILKDRIIYTKDWNLAYYTQGQADKKAAIISVKPNGENKQRVKEFSEQPAINIWSRLYAPEEVYLATNVNGKNSYYEYEDGKVTDANIDDDKFNSDYYATYLISPSGDKTFWFEPRDGKNILSVGDANAKNSKEIATMSDEFIPYGWFGDDYLLVSKKGSELYIMSRNNPKNDPVKVSDYHKPGLSYPGYGRGYGGF